MPPVAPTPVPAGPPVPDVTTPATTFDALYEAFNTWEKEDLQPGMNALATNVFNNATDAAASAAIAAASADAAVDARDAAVWASGTYATNAPAYSPINGLVYRRKAPGGASPTDPSADPTNWTLIATGDVTRDGVQTLTNKTLTAPALTNPAVTNYTETVRTVSGTAITIDDSLGSVTVVTTTGNCTITLPAAAAGKSRTIIVKYGGTHTLTFNGGTAIKWAGNTAPTPTSVNGKEDWYVFASVDTASTRGADAGRNF